MSGRTTHGDGFGGRLMPGEQEQGNQISNRSFDNVFTQDESRRLPDIKTLNVYDTESKFDNSRLMDISFLCYRTANICFTVERFVIIDSRIFLRECLQRSFQSSFAKPIDTYSTFLELVNGHLEPLPKLIFLSIGDGEITEMRRSLKEASILIPTVPTIVISCRSEIESLREAMDCGAKGYIPMTMGLDIAIEAVRFVLAGGIYFPAEYSLASASSALPLVHPNPPGKITARELAVIRAIQQGKPNKIIAYELNLCESTVKVHLRHIMRKLRARNRTEVAVRAAELLSLVTCSDEREPMGEASKYS
jgi:DNA-binding NarL/FixJ family response regulator